MKCDFYRTKLLTKFHEGRTINVASRVFTNKCGRTDRQTTDKDRSAHVSNQMDNKVISVRSQGLTETNFELNSRIKETNVLTKFHDTWAKNVTSRKNAPPTGSHVFSPIWTIFELVRDINKTNVLTNFHDDWTNIVTSIVFTRENCHYKHIEKNAPPTGGHVFSPIWTIFELVRDINKINVLITFLDEWAKIVTSIVFTRKTAPPTGGHVFQQTGTTFELNPDIIKTNILTNFELGREFIGAKLLTKFHKDGTTNQILTDGRTYDGQRPVRKAHLSNQVS
ncbi:hypothetical protein DPMN_002139 [Dreissena polymorpha]|uniref:Uncharacterized protein n=1 Tax=Dreissena polymorpha TaxID=45954 RepID=A0A9D4RTP6_DREPO|nr:hypothetical protein DPMN_002139 [Dreissena polymorpha]